MTLFGPRCGKETKRYLLRGRTRIHAGRFCACSTFLRLVPGRHLPPGLRTVGYMGTLTCGTVTPVYLSGETCHSQGCSDSLSPICPCMSSFWTNYDALNFWHSWADPAAAPPPPGTRSGQSFCHSSHSRNICRT